MARRHRASVASTMSFTGVGDLERAVGALHEALHARLVFGFDSWMLFYEKTRPLMASIMEAPYPQLYHANALTVFICAQ